MLRKLLLLIVVCYHLPAHSQVVTVNELVAVTDLTDKKLSGYVSKLGFVPTARNMEDGAIINEFYYSSKKNSMDTVMRFFSGFRNGKITGSIYETSSFPEFQKVLRTLRGYGFLSGNARLDSLLRADSTRTDTTTFFQKQNMTIRASEVVRDDVKMYKVILEKKPVPSGSSIRYAEDLLSFESHESIVALFGPQNVRRDIYHFSETDSTRCSVLFPDTDRQAIFIWDDQRNDRTISFLMIGGGLQAEGSNNFNESVALNEWTSHNGLYVGMRLKEMVKVNESDFDFYGMDSDFSLMVMPEKKGGIDFKKTGVTLGCLNCSGVPLLNKPKISAEAAMDAGLQLYIRSIVFLP